MKQTGSINISIIIFFSCLLPVTIINAQSSKNWFPYFDFNAADFKNPSREFGPYTRWWWPGNDVTNKELQREIKMFADNGFAGVEIQPLTMGINPNAPQDQLNKVYTWDTPSFYEHVKAVMEQAKKSGLTVDMTAGSGWPMGGPQVQPEESMLTLTYSDTIVTGGQTININVPELLPDYSKIIIFDTLHLYKKIDVSFAKLQAVIAARVLKKENQQFFIDTKTVIDITTHAANNRVNFKIPGEGEWIIIAFWAVPDGQIPTLIASRDPGLVVNHFDSLQVIKNYDHLFGERSGLKQYYGKPFRAVFNDSYEFRSDRHYAYNFISFFKQQRGYDITPWLAASLQPGYNNNAAAFIFPGAKPPFVFSDEDWRVRYDYDLAAGELLQKQFINASDKWMENRGLLHRTQAYGIKMDVIAASGGADIPEAEQLFAKGSEGFIKLITSGAHLYNRPVTTQESFVFFGRSEMTTPQKIKTLSDKAFTCGINQIIYSGTSYKYQTGDYGKEGWNTWSSPYSGFDFSSNINETYPYWKYIKDINLYITRCQYALRSGKPHTDVLIYFPFADFTQEDLIENPEEILANGYFKEFEPFEDVNAKKDPGVKEKWFEEVWKTINVLNASGITWEWVNDVSLQTATADQGNINVRGNEYRALLLVNASYIQLASAENITRLTKNGARLLVFGNAPGKQPGFLNYEENDHTTKQLIEESLMQSNSKQITDTFSLNSWTNTLSRNIRFNDIYKFTRTIEREMRDGNLLRFIWNQSGECQNISLTIDASYKNLYWLDPENGNIVIASSDHSDAAYMLPPYGSIILYAEKEKIPSKLININSSISGNTKEILRIENWNIRSGTAVIKNNSLFDWRNNEAFKYQSAKGMYTASFNLNEINGRKYLLDLGKVYFTAEVKLNGRSAGKRLWAPYELDITGLLHEGMNTIEIQVIPTLRNEFIHEASTGNKKYTQYKGRENSLMPAGLLGPVRILNLEQ